jgi:nucleotide sugar dehydrogenase
LEKQSGLKAGIDFNVVFSPERVFTGRIFEDLRKYPKIVGGITQECTNMGVNFYTQVLDFDKREDLPKPNGVWAVESTESAEFVKLAETTYRDVNIALANEFAIYACTLNINIYDVIKACNSQNFSNIHQPGMSVGGHCIPVYPQFLVWSNTDAKIVAQSRLLNSNMPNYTLDKIKKTFNNFDKLDILILGITYRPGVKEISNSGALNLLEKFNEHGIKIHADDEFYTQDEINRIGFKKNNKSKYNVVIIHSSSNLFANGVLSQINDVDLILVNNKEKYDLIAHADKIKDLFDK